MGEESGQRSAVSTQQINQPSGFAWWDCITEDLWRSTRCPNALERHLPESPNNHPPKMPALFLKSLLVFLIADR
jgi:hypothetical protein